MAQLDRLTVSSSPHIRDNASVRRIMLDVIIALIPAAIAGTVFFGFYALLIVALCTASCVLFEFLYCKFFKKEKSTTGDLSAAVTGLLLGLNLPPEAPLYIPVIGSLFAIAVVKMLFGGLGKNFANPAITARIFLMLSFAASMSKYILPIDYSECFFGTFFGGLFPDAAASATPVDASASATPLSGGSATLMQLFIGNVGGCIGETSALALIIGGIYLCVRRVIDLRLPLIIILTVAAFAFIFTGDISKVLPAVLSGGLILGSVFMATDYTTSPNSVKGMVIYALIIGLFTAILRQYSTYPEGMSFAILIGNIAAPLIDKYVYPKNFGEKGGRADAKKQ